MSGQTITASRRRHPSARRPASLAGAWHNVAVRSWIYQFLVVAGVIGVGAFLIGNAQDALSKQGISTGFGFLSQAAGFDIGETSIAFNSSDTFLRAYGVALLNTLKVAAAAIVLSTVVGVIVGVGRLSRNFIIRKLSAVYVEVFRNTPQLLQLVFWYTLIAVLPRPREPISLGDTVFLSNRGLSLPWFENASIALPLAAFVVASVIALMLISWAKASDAKVRKISLWFGLSLILVLPVLSARLSGGDYIVSIPELRGFNFQGGTTISPEFLALLLGLGLYIAAFIAEIVRSGIQSVGRGQIEAARTIGLSGLDTYRRVVFPQALRVMVPPAAGQYISVVKNSSLGVAIGYPELFSVNNTIVTLSGHTVEAISIMMSIYLAISFVIAMLMNLYNRFVQIKER